MEGSMVDWWPNFGLIKETVLGLIEGPILGLLESLFAIGPFLGLLCLFGYYPIDKKINTLLTKKSKVILQVLITLF